MASNHAQELKRLEKARLQELHTFQLEKKKNAEQQGGSCLSCRFTKIAFGKKLECRKKDKLVNQYNTCHMWEMKK